MWKEPVISNPVTKVAMYSPYSNFLCSFLALTQFLWNLARCPTDWILLIACFLALATLFEFSHSIPDVNGKAAQSIAREKITVWLIAKFQIERRLIRVAEEDASLGKLIAPAAITTAQEMPVDRRWRLVFIVLIVIVFPTTLETAPNKW